MIEVVPDTAPQVPEAHGDIEESGKERASSRRITKATHIWVWIVVALIVVVVIAVGAGIGTWRHREHSTTIRCESSKTRLLLSLHL